MRAIWVLHRHEQRNGGLLQRLCAAIVHLIPSGRFLVQEAIEYLCERGDEAERVVEEMEGQFSNLAFR